VQGSFGTLHGQRRDRDGSTIRNERKLVGESERARRIAGRGLFSGSCGYLRAEVPLPAAAAPAAPLLAGYVHADTRVCSLFASIRQALRCEIKR